MTIRRIVARVSMIVLIPTLALAQDTPAGAPTPRPARPSCRYKTRPIRSSTLTPASVTRP